ncbi:hypothetical protein THC_0166 [Caldimicrobium thiodismutans]|jgi:hypothetical protein|uniref:Uncharacterized protein n=1 Tax=Caldimicrobium thiodismutans TaxID=1653476 RepID=A0A0U4N047_9BACT|nr:hypothetical protein [Caldimicrobium thiodismutans]BAU22566.1 hypothetical protein THC_0166 [Caldimicrobium thiodismutans]
MRRKIFSILLVCFSLSLFSPFLSFGEEKKDTKDNSTQQETPKKEKKKDIGC